jgi:hypothetical protein
LLAFGPDAISALPDLKWPTGGAELRRYAVHTGQGGDLADTTGLIAETYGITGDALILIRPDGYLATVITADWIAAFDAATKAFA